MAFSPWLLSVKHLTQASLKTVTVIPDTHKSSVSPLAGQDDVCVGVGVVWGGEERPGGHSFTYGLWQQVFDEFSVVPNVQNAIDTFVHQLFLVIP